MTNKEMLVCIDTKLKELKVQFDNHLCHHFRITLILLGITGSAIITLLAFLLSNMI